MSRDSGKSGILFPDWSGLKYRSNFLVTSHVRSAVLCILTAKHESSGLFLCIFWPRYTIYTVLQITLCLAFSHLSNVLNARYTFLFAWIFTKNEHSSRGHSLNLSNDVMKSHCCLEKPWKNKTFSRIIYHRQSNHYNWWSKNTFWEQSTSFFA